MKNTAEAHYKLVFDSYIKRIDYLSIAKIFGDLSNYSLDMLYTIYENESNREFIDIGTKDIKYFIDVFNLTTTNNETVIIFKDEVLNLISQNYLNDRTFDKTRLYLLCKLGFVVAFYKRLENRLDSKTTVIKKLDDLSEIKDYKYFRGQSNFNWKMSPSVLRDLNKKIIFDDNYYYKLLKDNDLEDKFNDLPVPFGEKRYRKYAFMQHACSFSPFIDFTNDPVIATSFALSNSEHFNQFNNVDSAVICMKFNDYDSKNIITDKIIARDFIVSLLKFEVINSDYFVFGKTYILKNSIGLAKKICFYTFTDLLDAMTPKYKIIDIPTNDRMIYQKGLFICFYDFLCLNDYIAYELCSSLQLKKLKIAVADKRNILNSIYEKNRKYDPEHLMDPYLIFKE